MWSYRGRPSRSRLALFCWLALLGVGAVTPGAAEPSPGISRAQSTPPSTQESPPPNLQELGNSIGRHLNILAEGLTELSTEHESLTQGLNNDTQQSASDLNQAGQLVSDSEDMQNSRDSAQTTLKDSTAASENSESTAIVAIEAKAAALARMTRSRDGWRMSTIVTVAVALALLLF